MSCSLVQWIELTKAGTPPTDWFIEESRIHGGYHASLGDIQAHSDTLHGAAQSLSEKLDLYRKRLLSVAQPPSRADIEKTLGLL
jgi:hypothetical protein